MAGVKRILIVGGGYSGVWAGKLLEKRFRKDGNVEITLVDRNDFHTLMTELHEVAGHRVEPESVQVSFRKIFGGRKIRIVQDSITTIDFAGKKAVSAANEYPFDYIVLGSGAQPEFFGIPGVKENSFTLWSFDDAIRIRRHLEDMFLEAARETDPGKRKALLTFAVAGSGFTGIELIGELLEYRETMCRRHHIDKKDTRVVVIEALPDIVPILEEPLRVKAAKYLHRHGCEIMVNTAVVGAEPGLVKFKDGGSLPTGTFIWTCGVKGSAFSECCGLAKAERSRGRLSVTAEMRSPDFPNVFIVGDNSFLLENGKPLPQIVEAAHQTAEVAAHNIIVDIEGKGKPKSFKSNFHGFMVSLGGRYGVANAGGMKTSGFMAMAMKHLINMWYLFGIAGVNQVWEYAKHEFLDIKERRAFIGGFAEYKVRGYWPLLLRLWLGFMWVVEGVNKILEGWLDFSTGQSKSGWLFSPGVVQAGVQPVVDATAAATAAVEAAPVVVEATSAATGAAGEVAAEAAGQTAVAITKLLDPSMPIIDPNSPFVTWFRQTFMDGIFAYIPYPAMQTMIVVMEIGIGLALFGGFFTWWAAVASIVMCAMFTFSGMFSWGQLWFVFAAIVMMGGAGRSFGLDYWSVPFFKRWWNGRRFARRHHFYLDDPSK